MIPQHFRNKNQTADENCAKNRIVAIAFEWTRWIHKTIVSDDSCIDCAIYFVQNTLSLFKFSTSFLFLFLLLWSHMWNCFFYHHILKVDEYDSMDFFPHVLRFVVDSLNAILYNTSPSKPTPALHTALPHELLKERRTKILSHILPENLIVFFFFSEAV